jgi:predicted phosphodiesterase
MKKIKNIALMNGPLLVFGGVYSNLQALEQLQAIARVQGILPDNIICTGDVVAYCAQPEEVVQLIRDWGIHCVAGNVEIQLREGEEDCGCSFNEDSRCDLLSRQWYPYAQQQLSQESIDWMHTLPDFIRFDYAGKKVLVVHGSYFDISEFIFRSTPWPVKQANFSETQTDVILAGHCGLPFYHQQENQLEGLNSYRRYPAVPQQKDGQSHCSTHR